MKKDYKKITIVAALLLVAISLNAQFATRNAKSVLPGQQEGFFYSLPKTSLRLDFVIEETVMIEGPYSAYADRYLGATNPIRGKSRQFKMVDVTVNGCSEADPDATFFVEFTRKAAKKVNVIIDEKGILDCFAVGETLNETRSSANVAEQMIAKPDIIDTSMIFRLAVVPAMGRPIEQQARLAAEKITELRDAKMKLLTGYQEVAFEGEAVKNMYNELDNLEKEYISLFMGKRLSKIVVKSLYVTPTAENNVIEAGRFSTRNGLSSSPQADGELITVSVTTLKTTAAIKAPSHSAIESIAHENKLIYRIPEMTNVKVACGNRLLAEQRQYVSQFGVLLLAPIGKSSNCLRFDTNTGMLIGVSRE